MDISLEKSSSTDALIKIKLKQDDFQPKVDQKIREYAKKMNIKGFRPGKVPTGLVKKMYGKSILVEEINHILSDSIKNYIQENDLEIIGDPLPKKESTEKIDWDTPADMEFEYEIGTVDDFKLDLSKKRKVKAYEIKVDKKLIDETIENLRDQHGSYEEVEKAEKGDVLYGNLKQVVGEIENKTTLSSQLIKDKEFKKFHGSKPGDTLKFDINKVTESDAAISQITGADPEKSQGEHGQFEFLVEKVNRKKLAEVNQELFDKLFGKDQIKSKEEFRSKIEEVIKKNYAEETETLLTRDIQKTLIDETKMALPDEFLKKWLEATNEKLSKEQIENEFDPYKRELKWNLIKNRIAKEYDVKVEHEDVIETTKDMFRKQFGGAQLPEMEDKLGDFADNYLKGNEGQNYMQVYNQVFADRVMELIKEKIEVKKDAVSLDKFRKVAEN